MSIEGLHHVTAITGDAQANVDFYDGLLGLSLVKKTVNFDQPDVYHLYYGDDAGTPGSVLTFFEFPGAARGRAGAGMVHTVRWRVASADALAFWVTRLNAAHVATAETSDAVVFSDSEGLTHELVIADVPDAPLSAAADEIPPEHALQGFDGVRAYAAQPTASAPLLTTLGMTETAPQTWEAAGEQRRASLIYEPPPEAAGIQSAGSVHHIAWSVADDAELTATRALAVEAAAHATPIIDRQYFHSVYFREPSGVLFELATRDIGFDVDEPRESLGQALKLPPQYEDRRDALEHALTPIVDPRSR